MERYDLNTSFFYYNETDSVFPTLNMKKEYIPVGDSITMCLAMYWGKKGMTSYSFMNKVEGFPICSQTQTGKFIWNDDDSKNGVDIPVWRQTMHDAHCSDAECDDWCKKKYNGFFVDGIDKHVCYSYEVINKICLVMEYDENKNQFTYTGGCFKNGAAYEMEPIQLERAYSFDDIEITVREEGDPMIKAGKMSNYSYSFGNSIRYLAIILNIILIANVGFLGYTIYLIFQERSTSQQGLKENQDA